MPEDERYKDPEWLYEQLVDEDRYQYDVAAECGVSQKTISYWKAKFEDDEWPTESDSAPDPPRATLLGVDVGEKIKIDQTLAEEWETPSVVGSIDETEWQVPAGENWVTRQITCWKGGARSHESMAVYQLSVGIERLGLRQIEGSESAATPRGNGTEAAVTGVDVVGSVGMQGQIYLRKHYGEDDADERPSPDGDDSWQEYYQRGESA